MSRRRVTRRRRRRAISGCRRLLPERATASVEVEPPDPSIFTVWPSIGRQLPPRSVILDMLCFYATRRVMSDLMEPLAFDDSAWLADQLVDRVIDLVRTWEPTTDWQLSSLKRSGRALEWVVWRVATEADDELAPLYEEEAATPWQIALDSLPRYDAPPTVIVEGLVQDE